MNMTIKKRWYKQYKLLSFDDGMLVPFGDGEYYNSYTLTIQVEYLWGLFTKVIEQEFKVSMFASPVEHESHWQMLIDTGQYFYKG